MLVVPHFVARSAIHGLGVFASRRIEKDELVWRYDPEFDVEIPFDLVEHFVDADKEAVFNHAEYVPSRNTFILGNDADIFMNHSDEPSLVDAGSAMYAARTILPGEELTCDYQVVTVLGFTGA